MNSGLPLVGLATCFPETQWHRNFPMAWHLARLVAPWALLIVIAVGAALIFQVDARATMPRSSPAVADSGRAVRPDVRRPCVPVRTTLPSSIDQPGNLPPSEALYQPDPAPRGEELRPSQPGLSLVPRGGPGKNDSPDPPRHLGPSPLVNPRLSLQILFCTWQT